MKIKFNSDDVLPLKKTLELCDILIVVQLFITRTFSEQILDFNQKHVTVVMI